MRKILAILLFIVFVAGVTSISVGVFGNLQILDVPEWLLWLVALFIFFTCLPIAIKLGDKLEDLWNHD